MSNRIISVLWLGTGDITHSILPYLNTDAVRIAAFIDDHIHSNNIYGYNTVQIEDINMYEYDYLFIGKRDCEYDIQKLFQYGIQYEKIVSLDFEHSLYIFVESLGKMFSKTRFADCFNMFISNNEILNSAFIIDDMIKYSPMIKKIARGWDVLRAICTKGDGSTMFAIDNEAKLIAEIFSRYAISYAHHADDIFLYKAFGSMKKGFYVDAGASDPIIGSYTKKLYDDFFWKGINIEPRKEAIIKYEKCRTRDINCCVAVSDRRGKSAFFEKKDSSTLIRDNALRLGMDKFQQTEVETVLLNDILDEYGVDTIHLLKIDCEQSEKQVLSGLDLSRHRPWMLSIESTLPHTAIPTHEEWESDILRRGYVFLLQNFDTRIYVLKEKYDFFQNNLSRNPFVLSVEYRGLQKIYNYIKALNIDRRDDLLARVAALAGREVYFFGYGAAYETYKHLFAATRPKAILVDMVPASGLQETVDGLPVRFAKDVLPPASARSEILPLIIFAREAWASSLASKLSRLYPAFAGDNMLICRHSS